MANENNNINELVSDDDVTAELELPNFRGAFNDDNVRESDEHTFDVNAEKELVPAETPTLSDLQSDLRSRKKTIGRLQFDIEQLRSKWLGLEAEIEAREKQTVDLTNKVDSLENTLSRKERLIKKRDRRIKSLKSEIRERQESHHELTLQMDDVNSALAEAEQQLQAKPKEPTVIEQPVSRDLEFRLAHSEEYADGLRQQVQDLIDGGAGLERSHERLEQDLERANQAKAELAEQVTTLSAQTDDLDAKLTSIEERHAEEIRTLRFELGAAQDTVVEKEDLNTQLASDLCETKSFKDELERLLADAEEQAQTRIEELQSEMNSLAESAEDYEQKLSTKSEAIAVLLAELAKKSEQLDSIGAIEDVIHDIDDRISERIADDVEISGEVQPSDKSGRSDRITRLLVGTIDDQVLRFPLFKDRLTIGRTDNNDIQLEAAYISRRHAVIQTDAGATRIIDWGSKNGVYVNSDRVKEHFLEHGDIVTIGNARFRYEERKKRDDV